MKSTRAPATAFTLLTCEGGDCEPDSVRARVHRNDAAWQETLRGLSAADLARFRPGAIVFEMTWRDVKCWLQSFGKQALYP